MADPEPSPGLSRDLRRFLLIRALEPQEVVECNESSSEESSEESSCEESSSSSSSEESSSSADSSSEETGVPCDANCRITLNGKSTPYYRCTVIIRVK